MKRNLLKKKLYLIITFLFFIVLFLFFIKQIKQNKVKTELVLNGTLENYVDTNCLVLRDETLVETPNGEIINFMLEEGEKLECGKIIAHVYESENDKVFINKIKKLDENISNLENLQNMCEKTFGKKEYVSKIICTTLCEIKLNSLENDYSNFKENHKKVLDALSIKNELLNKNEDLSEKIMKLKKERESLEKSLKNKNIKKIVSNSPGYIAFSTDGFENILQLEKLKNLTPKTVNDLLNSEPNKINNKAKIVKSANWYIVCNVPIDKLEKIEAENDVELSSFGSISEKIPSKIIYINKNPNKDNLASLVLKCNYMNKEVLNFRKGNIRIVFKKYIGLKFRKSALHKKIVKKTEKDPNSNENSVNKAIFGVYVLDEKDKNKKIFKEIEPLFSDDEYVICKNNEEQENNAESVLRQYDEVVI